MKHREFAVNPDFEAFQEEAVRLFQGIQIRDGDAVQFLDEWSTDAYATGAPDLAHVQDAVARSYGFTGWHRLTLACRMTNAIWADDIETVRSLIEEHPNLLHENARGIPCNWGPPMSHAANLGRTNIIRMLLDKGATDLTNALVRASIKGHIDTARVLVSSGAKIPIDATMGPAETVNGDGMEFALELGAKIQDASGNVLAPVALVLETYCRNPAGKHKCLELFAAHGIGLPDTPPMAMHRGRIDLLEAHLAKDPLLLNRTFPHEEIFPPELGCHSDYTLALIGTPFADGTLLHMCVDYDEMELAKWLLDHGADPNATVDIDSDGFGGNTPIFGCVVNQSFRTNLRTDTKFAELLIDHGAKTDVRASLKKRMRFVDDEDWHEYRSVTPVEWGDRFHEPEWVSTPVLELLRSLS